MEVTLSVLVVGDEITGGISALVIALWFGISLLPSSSQSICDGPTVCCQINLIHEKGELLFGWIALAGWRYSNWKLINLPQESYLSQF